MAIVKCRRNEGEITAIQLTPISFNDVADFIGEHNLEDGTYQQECFIDFRNQDEDIKNVLENNWVIKIGNSFDVLTDEEFHKQLTIIDPESISTETSGDLEKLMKDLDAATTAVTSPEEEKKPEVESDGA